MHRRSMQSPKTAPPPPPAQQQQQVNTPADSFERGDWNAVLRLVSDQARAIKGIVGASSAIEARVQRVESWQMEQIAGGGVGGQAQRGPAGTWSSAEIDAADGWQVALSGLNERMGRVGNAFGQYVKTNAARVEKLEARLDGPVASRLASIEQMAAQVSTVAHALASNEAYTAATNERIEARFSALERELRVNPPSPVSTVSGAEEGNAASRLMFSSSSGGEQRMTHLEQTVAELDKRAQSLEAWRSADSDAHRMVSAVDQRLSSHREKLSVRLTELEIQLHAKAEAEAAAEKRNVEVVVPEDSEPGDTVHVQVAGLSGKGPATIEVEIPEGVMPGEAFELAVVPPSSGRGESLLADQGGFGPMSAEGIGHLAEWRQAHEHRLLSLEQQLADTVGKLNGARAKQAAAPPSPQLERARPAPVSPGHSLLADVISQGKEPEPEPEPKPEPEPEPTHGVPGPEWHEAWVREQAEGLQKIEERLSVYLKENVDAVQSSASSQIETLAKAVVDAQAKCDGDVADLTKRLDDGLSSAHKELAFRLEALEAGHANTGEEWEVSTHKQWPPATT